MRNIAIIILSVVLAAAIIFGIIFYQRHHDTRDALQISEKKLAEAGETLSKLNQENLSLRDQIRKNAEHLQELKNAQARISELENAITMKDQALSGFNETIRMLKRDLTEESKTKEALRTELASKDAMITELQEKFQPTQSHILNLEQEIAKAHNEIQGLEQKLLSLKGEAAKETLKDELASKDALVTELKKRLQEAQSHTLCLEEEIVKNQNEIEALNRKLLILKGEKATAEMKMGQLKSTYEDLISDLKQQIENQEVTIKEFEEKISVTFVDYILFEFGRANITPEGKTILKRVGKILKKLQGRKIRVVGHSDNIPIVPEYRSKFPSNWELSAARASAVVRDFQQNAGIDPSNLEAVGRSFYDPIASNETEKGRAQNRRVEIIIAPQIE